MSETSIPSNASIFLEDFVVTQLLRKGKSLRSAELSDAAEGFHLTRGALHEALKDNPLVIQEDREWTLSIRLSKRDQTKEERDRQPMEASVSELLLALGKPLPTPVITREVSTIRDVWRPNMPELAQGALQAARHVTAVAPNVFLHAEYTLELDHAFSSEDDALRLVAENHLDTFPKFQQLSAITFADPTDLEQNALQLLRAAQSPVPRKLITFLLWKQHPAPFDYAKVLSVLADRNTFHSLTRGFITSVDQLPTWRASFVSWARSLSGAALASIDVGAILRQYKPQDVGGDAREIDTEEIKSFARVARDAVDLPTLLTEALELEADDPQFIPTLVAVNSQLRSDPDFITAGVGSFLLRELVPPNVTAVPEELRPVQLSVTDPVTNEPVDFEMSDDGLEGDAADFVHDPQWGDVSEEIEVKFVPGKQSAQEKVRYIILAHHHRAGTLKLRRSDEEFFGISGPLTRLNVQTPEGDVEAWASRESSLISGLGDWFRPQTPVSGGVILFNKQQGTLQAEIGENDAMTFISEDRAEQLEHLRAAANYMSLYEVLQNIMSEHHSGMELPGLWAEVNLVRRTSKRLLVSVLCGYHCFYFKQRGPKQILWRLDENKVDQGFKRNKRKYVRR